MRKNWAEMPREDLLRELYSVERTLMAVALEVRLASQGAAAEKKYMPREEWMALLERKRRLLGVKHGLQCELAVRKANKPVGGAFYRAFYDAAEDELSEAVMDKLDAAAKERLADEVPR